MYYIVYILIGYIFGIIITQNYGLTGILFFSGIYFIISYILSKKILFNILLIFFILLSCFSFNYKSNSTLFQYINEDIDIIAEIKAEKKSNKESKYIGYEIEVKEINGVNIKEKSIIYVKEYNKVIVNSLIKANVKVSKIEGTQNIGLFSYNEYLKGNGINVTLFSNGKLTILNSNSSYINIIVEKVISKIESIFRENMSSNTSNIILSIILGNTDYLEDDLYKNIQKTGLAHIFAVSGLHIGIIYSYLIKLLLLFGVRRRISWIISCIILWIYGFLIGYPVSVLRGLIMFTVLFGSQIMYRKYNSLNSLAFSALILLIINPYYLYQVGFILSYSAAGSLLIFNKLIKKVKVKNNIYKNFLLYVFLQIVTLPVTSYYFNYLSIIGILFNLFFLPLFSLIVVISFIAIPIGILGNFLVVFPLKFINYILNFIELVVDRGANSIIAGINIKSMNLEVVLFYYIFLIIIINMDKIKEYFNRKIAITFFIVFYFINLIIIPYVFRGVTYTIVDVGQGLFSILKYGEITLIFDVGSNTNNIGKYVIEPYLLKNGIKNIDAIFISHNHSDHYNGLENVINIANIDNIYCGFDNMDKTIPYEPKQIEAYKKFLLSNNIKVELLWPAHNYESSNKNNTSFVFLITIDGIKILFTGDIEMEVEKVLKNKLENVDILIVPHHGSKTSSTDEFINAIRPKIAVLSYGKNKFGIPNKSVLKRYEDIGAKVLSTYDSGEINFMVINNEIYYNTYKGMISENWRKIYTVKNWMNFLALIICTSFLFMSKNKLYLRLQSIK